MQYIQLITAQHTTTFVVRYPSLLVATCLRIIALHNISSGTEHTQQLERSVFWRGSQYQLSSLEEAYIYRAVFTLAQVKQVYYSIGDRHTSFKQNGPWLQPSPFSWPPKRFVWLRLLMLKGSVSGLRTGSNASHAIAKSFHKRYGAIEWYCHDSEDGQQEDIATLDRWEIDVMVHFVSPTHLKWLKRTAGDWRAAIGYWEADQFTTSTRNQLCARSASLER